MRDSFFPRGRLPAGRDEATQGKGRKLLAVQKGEWCSGEQGRAIDQSISLDLSDHIEELELEALKNVRTGSNHSCRTGEHPLAGE